MAIGGHILSRGRFPSLAVLSCSSDGHWGATAPRASGMPPTRWGEDKRKTGTGMVQYTGSYSPTRGEKPSSPRSRASSLCNPPVGRSSGRVHPENVPITHTSCPYHYGKEVQSNKAAVIRSLSVGPRGQDGRAEAGENGAVFARPGAARDSTSREAGWS